MNLEREKELFEKAYCNFQMIDCGGDTFEKYPNGDYVRQSLHIAWKMWIDSASRDGYKLVPVEPTEDQWGGLARHLGRYMQTHDRYCPKTLKKYFDRFIGEPPEWLTKEVGNWESDHAFATADLPVFIYKSMLGAVE